MTGGLSFFKQAPFRDERYLAWVRTQPCCGCGVRGQQHAHHCIANRHGTGKASDLHAMPLCAPCHRELHAGWVAWEMLHGEQWFHVARTLERAASLGILSIDPRAIDRAP